MFIFPNESSSIIRICHNWLIYSFATGFLKLFSVLAIINKVTMHIHVEVFVWTYITYLGVEWLDHMIGWCILNF